jgi:hypothetical protein
MSLHRVNSAGTALFTLFRISFLAILLTLFLTGTAPTHGAEYNSAPLAGRIQGKRFSATRTFSARITQEEAAIAAETAASDAAMQYLMQLLVTLPEVPIVGGNASSTVKTPNLLALAHASAETELLLMSRSKKKNPR